MPAQWHRALIGGALGLWLLASLWTAGHPLAAAPAPQAPILRPEDVTTPTPTPAVVSLPTPTAVPGTSTPSSLAESRRVAGQSYIVQPGDTLWTIALEVG